MTRLGSPTLGLALVLGAFWLRPATANIITPSGAYSGVMAPWNKTTFAGEARPGPRSPDDPVALTRVDLGVDVFPMFVRVEATFTLHSSADKPTVRRVGLPIRPYGDKGLGGVPLDDLVVEAGEHLVDAPKPISETVCLSHLREPAPGGPFYVIKPGPRCERGQPVERRWWVWRVTVPPGKPMVTRVSYLQLLSAGPTYQGRLSSYMMQTLDAAAAWGGPIGRLSMEVRLHGVEVELDARSPLEPTRTGDTLRWTLTDYEPGPTDTLGFRFTTTPSQWGGRAVTAPYLPADIDRRLRMQDYLNRFVATDTAPTAEEWITFIKALRQVIDDDQHPISRAWAHGLLIALREWALASLVPERERAYDRANSDYQPVGGLKPIDPPGPIPAQFAQLQTWLTPDPLDAEARAVALEHPHNLRQRGGLYRGRWRGKGAESLAAAADMAHTRRLLIRGGWSGVAVLVLVFGLINRRRRRELSP